MLSSSVLSSQEIETTSCPSTDEWIKKWGTEHNGIWSFAATWMVVVVIMLS